MNNAVITVSMGKSHTRLGSLTLPLMKIYAKRIEAAFEVIRQPAINLGMPHYEKFQIYEYLDRYERIIFFDDDLIVRPECPNLFEVVPATMFGACVVDKFNDFHSDAMRRIQNRLGEIGWKESYFNSGVMVVARAHREVFAPKNLVALGPEFFFDQTQINFNVQRQQVPLFDIGYRFNHTTAPGRQANRFHSYIIHYPGQGHRPGGKLEQIYLDLNDLRLNQRLSVLRRLSIWLEILITRPIYWSLRAGNICKSLNLKKMSWRAISQR